EESIVADVGEPGDRGLALRVHVPADQALHTTQHPILFAQRGDEVGRFFRRSRPKLRLRQRRRRDALGGGLAGSRQHGEQQEPAHPRTLAGEPQNGKSKIHREAAKDAKFFWVFLPGPPPRWPVDEQKQTFADFAASRWKLQWLNRASS